MVMDVHGHETVEPNGWRKSHDVSVQRQHAVRHRPIGIIFRLCKSRPRISEACSGCNIVKLSITS